MEKQDLVMTWIYDLPSPEEIFTMVMEYAHKTQKPSWQCMGQVFNANHYSAAMVMLTTGKCGGYLNGWLNNDGDLYLNHAYLRHKVTYRKGLIHDFHRMVEESEGKKIKQTIFITDIPARLWVRYGFTPSKNILFERRF